MTIPESQLETWSHQGSITQSATTYATVKRALEDSGTGYANRQIEIFLQGSYANNTNIYAESDVDIVIQCNDIFFRDVDNLSPAELTAYNSYFSDASYGYASC